MLEIIFLYRLCGLIGGEAREKGRRAIGYQFMLILLWFTCEIAFALLTGLFIGILYGVESDYFIFFVYFGGLGGAALGAGLAFGLVALLPKRNVKESPEMVTK